MPVRIPQWVFVSFPWMTDVLDWLMFLKDLWSQYQSLVILVGLVLVARRLRREREKLSERVDTLAQIVKATRDETEAALVQPQAPSLPNPNVAAAPADGSTADYWDIIRSDWRDVRDRIELKIEEIGRRRVRGKYSRIPRYRYREVIQALEKDGELSPKVADELLRMDTLFNRFKFKPKSIPDAEVSKFREALHIVSPFLPKLPEPEEPRVPATSETFAGAVSRAA